MAGYQITRKNPLTEDTPLWLRLWGHATLGSNPGVEPPPIQEKELAANKLPNPPWTPPGHIIKKAPKMPADAPKRDWYHVRGSLGATGATFLSNDLVLRVAWEETDKTFLKKEELIISKAPLAPTLKAAGDGWIAVAFCEGTHPQRDGNWVGELQTFREKLRLQNLPVCKPWEHKIETAKNLDTQQKHVALNSPRTLVHGDLHARNLLVNEKGNLQCVLDFETLSWAPKELDLAKWITVLAGQVGLDTIKKLAGMENFNPVVVAACLAVLARHSKNAAERIGAHYLTTTADYLYDQATAENVEALLR